MNARYLVTELYTPGKSCVRPVGGGKVPPVESQVLMPVGVVYSNDQSVLGMLRT